MEWLLPTAQLLIGLVLLNVWLLRYNRSTAWRGGSAANMREEFAHYGFPTWFMGLVGGLKVTLAVLLIGGIWIPGLTSIAAVGIAY